MSTKITRNTFDPAHLPPVLTVKEFARLSDYSTATVRSWIKSGRLRATRPGPRAWSIPRSELGSGAGLGGGAGGVRLLEAVLLAVAAFVLPALLLGGVWWWIQVIRLVIIGAFF